MYDMTNSSAEARNRDHTLFGNNTLTWNGRTPGVSIPKPARGVSRWGENNKVGTSYRNEDFLITRLIQKIEDLQLSQKKASSARSPIAHLVDEPAICWNSPESAKVLRHHHNNRLRMLTHTWKKLGLQYPLSKNKDDHTFQHVKSHAAVKNNCPLKISAIQTAHTVAQQDRKERMKGSLYSSSNIPDVGFPELKVSDTGSPHVTAVSLESNSDESDLSDQEKESAQVSKWAALIELDLKPEPYIKDLDLSCSTETEAGQPYAEVLPAPLKDLDFTQRPSFKECSESQLSWFTTDPCLAPLVSRLLELERLQNATVQKEQGKPVRSRPATAVAPAQNPNRLRNGDLPGCKLGVSGDEEFHSVTCSFTKLVLCPNPLCRNRHTCTLTKSGHRSKDVCPKLFSSKCAQNTSGQFNRRAFSASVSPKPTTSSRIKRQRATKKSTKPRRADSSTSAKRTVTPPSGKT